MFGRSMQSAVPETNSTTYHGAARVRFTAVLFTCLSIALLIGPLGCASSRGGSTEPGSIQITLANSGAEASSNELTLDALRAGRSTYTIQGEDGTYTVELTEDQIADLIAGSTVMTEASGENGSESVRITVAKASRRGFGW